MIVDQCLVTGYRCGTSVITPVSLYWIKPSRYSVGSHPDGLRLAKYRMTFTSAKAEAELGYRARPYREGLVEAIDWFRQAGYLG